MTTECTDYNEHIKLTNEVMLCRIIRDHITKETAVLELAVDSTYIDGARHKQWFIDQMVRVLLGKDYENWVTLHEEDGEEWDTGVPP